MVRIFQDMVKTGIIWMIGIGLILIICGGCEAPTKIFTIGIVGYKIIDTRTYDGFKAGMAELGYIEGKNIKCIYTHIPVLDEEVIYDKIKELLAREVDLVLVKETPVILQAKKILTGSDIPVLILESVRPVENGFIESLRHPGGNLTGTRVADIFPKSFEWLAMIVPQAKKIYIPYNPNDFASTEQLPGLEEAASLMGIEPVFKKIYSIEETIAEIENLPEDIGAIFFVPSPAFNPIIAEISEAAIKRRIPMGTSIVESGSALINFTPDAFNTGKNAARIAKQILQGTKPADIPVETAEVILTINIKTAEQIGIKVPNDILIQADKIIR